MLLLDYLATRPDLSAEGFTVDDLVRSPLNPDASLRPEAPYLNILSANTAIHRLIRRGLCERLERGYRRRGGDGGRGSVYILCSSDEDILLDVLYPGQMISTIAEGFSPEACLTDQRSNTPEGDGGG